MGRGQRHRRARARRGLHQGVRRRLQRAHPRDALSGPARYLHAGAPASSATLGRRPGRSDSAPRRDEPARVSPHSRATRSAADPSPALDRLPQAAHRPRTLRVPQRSLLVPLPLRRRPEAARRQRRHGGPRSVQVRQDGRQVRVVRAVPRARDQHRARHRHVSARSRPRDALGRADVPPGRRKLPGRPAAGRLRCRHARRGAPSRPRRPRKAGAGRQGRHHCRRPAPPALRRRARSDQGARRLWQRTRRRDRHRRRPGARGGRPGRSHRRAGAAERRAGRGRAPVDGHPAMALVRQAARRDRAAKLPDTRRALVLRAAGPAWSRRRGARATGVGRTTAVSSCCASPYTGHLRDAEGKRRAPRFGLAEIPRLLTEARSDPRVIMMIVLGGTTSFLVGNAFQAQMPEYAHHLGADEAGAWYSVLLAANAVGAIIGAVLLESAPFIRLSARTAIGCAVVWGVLMALFPAAQSYPAAVILLVLAGTFNIAFTSMAQTIIQLLAPPHLRSRMVGLFNTSMLGLRAGSGATVRVLGPVIGVQWSLTLSSTAVVLIALGLLVIHLRSRPRPGLSV